MRCCKKRMHDTACEGSAKASENPSGRNGGTAAFAAFDAFDAHSLYDRRVQSRGSRAEGRKSNPSSMPKIRRLVYPIGVYFQYICYYYNAMMLN